MLQGAYLRAIEKGATIRDEESDVACRCVLDLLPALKPEYAAIVERVDLGGVPVPQAAAALGSSPTQRSP